MIDDNEDCTLTAGVVVGAFASLINSKVIIPSNSSHYFAVDKFFLMDLLAPSIDRIAVDERWYLFKYPDVRDAVTRGIVNSGRDHYRRHGYFEGRIPHPIHVDAGWYESTYPDVQEAIRRQDFESAQEHYEKLGFAEGRLPFAGFAFTLRDAAS